MQSVNPKQFVAPGTTKWEVVAFIGALILWPAIFIGIALMTWGIGLVIWGVKAWMDARKARTRLLGSAIKVGPQQFAEIHKTAVEISRALGVIEPPEIWILESNEQNAFALKHGKKHSVILVDDIVHGATSTNNPNVLAWILAHEIAHQALSHTDVISRSLRALCPPLKRLDEISCDRVASAVVKDPSATRDALTLLLVGPHLFSRVDHRALETQAKALMDSKSQRKAAESGLTHPLLVHRYALAAAAAPRQRPAFATRESAIPALAEPSMPALPE